MKLPGVRVNLPAITQKDRRDIQWGLDNDVDFIAWAKRQAIPVGPGRGSGAGSRRGRSARMRC